MHQARISHRRQRHDELEGKSGIKESQPQPRRHALHCATVARWIARPTRQKSRLGTKDGDWTPPLKLNDESLLCECALHASLWRRRRAPLSAVHREDAGTRHTNTTSFSLVIVVTCVSVVRVLLASTWAHPLPLVDGITQINDHASPSLLSTRRAFALVERRSAQTSVIPIQRQLRHKPAEIDAVSSSWWR